MRDVVGDGKTSLFAGVRGVWDVAPAEATNDTLTQELRTQYEKDRKSYQKFYY